MKKLLALIILTTLILTTFVSAYGYYDSSYKNTKKYERVDESKYEDEWGYRKTKTTISQKTEVEINSKTPYYVSPTVARYYNVPASNWRFKAPYTPNRYYKGSPYGNYYYEPRYDPVLGHYNWRW